MVSRTSSNIKREFKHLPFCFYYSTEPKGAMWRLIGYDYKGNEFPLRPVGYVEEIRNETHITRGLEDNEI
ncbi:MAG TPA: hypothetical protein VL854_00040 [Nitrososphaeraceae archaeon]|jgi:hypothetical protein|nr:hypothetical protein [Nitrososphaeraceae archaeon]